MRNSPRRKPRPRRQSSFGSLLPALSLKTRFLVLAGLTLASAAAIWLGGEQSASAQNSANGAAGSCGAVAKLEAAALAKVIDEEVNRRLEKDKLKASPLADDATFLRRIYLDLIGVIPPREKVVAFLDSTEADKRAKVVEELLADPRFGRFFGEMWAERMIPRDSTNRQLVSEPLHLWLAQQFNENRPWNKVVYDLVTASGTVEDNGAVTYFIANTTVDKMTDSVTQLFMGVQLQCAQCHNHPFTKWKQDEYWGMAQFFMNVRAPNAKMVMKNGTGLVSEPGGKRKKGQELPESAKVVPARFLQGQQVKLPSGAPYRPLLASWMTSTDNPFFARAFANKMWHHFFGRGLVNPVDDMHDGNAPSHPAILSALAEQVKCHDFDVKYLIRSIVLSETYQRSSRPAHGNQTDTELFSHMAVRNLTPHQLYDSLVSVVGPGGKADKGDKAKKAKAKAKAEAKAKAKDKKGDVARQQFINFFHVEDADPLEYQAGIPQALRLMNSPMMNNPGPLVDQAMQSGQQPAQVIEWLHLAILSRRPTEEESKRYGTYVNRPGTTPRNNYGNIVWALLNSGEFAHNH